MHRKSAPAAIFIITLGIVLVPNKNNSANFSGVKLEQFSSYLKKPIFFDFYFIFFNSVIEN